MDTIFWLLFGVLTAWLMYGDKEKIPVAKAVAVILFGWVSFIIWVLFNLKTEVNNWLLDIPKIKKKREQKNKK